MNDVLRRELEQHCQMITKLLEDIEIIQYDVREHLRHVMHEGVLAMHFDYWSPFRMRYGDVELLDIVWPHVDLVSGLTHSPAAH